MDTETEVMTTDESVSTCTRDSRSVTGQAITDIRDMQQYSRRMQSEQDLLRDCRDFSPPAALISYMSKASQMCASEIVSHAHAAA